MKLQLPHYTSRYPHPNTKPRVCLKMLPQISKSEGPSAICTLLYHYLINSSHESVFFWIVKRLYISRVTLIHTHMPAIPLLSNVAVIEVGTRGCSNRWAHMLLGRFIRLSHQHSGQVCLDTLYVCVCGCVYVLPLSTGQVRNKSVSSHSWSRTDSAPLGYATPSSSIHLLATLQT